MRTVGKESPDTGVKFRRKRFVTVEFARLRGSRLAYVSGALVLKVYFAIRSSRNQGVGTMASRADYITDYKAALNYSRSRTLRVSLAFSLQIKGNIRHEECTMSNRSTRIAGYIWIRVILDVNRLRKIRELALVTCIPFNPSNEFINVTS